MLFLEPQNVTLDTTTLEHVSAISFDRTADRLAVEYSDKGPHAVFADVPQQRVSVTIVRDLIEGDPLISGVFVPGFATALTFATAPADSDAQRLSFSAALVITAVEHDLTRAKGAVLKITAVALSTDGLTDPIVPVKGGR